jgi:hypothetical protein
MLPRLPARMQSLRAFTPRLLLAAAAIIAVALITAAALIAGSSGGRSPIAAALSRPGPESIFDPKGPLFTDPVGTLGLMRRLGVDRVKLFIPWNAIAPNPLSRATPRFAATNPAAYPASAWSSYDTIVRDAAARGIALYLAVGGPAPLWAAGKGAPPHTPLPGVWKPSATQFESFVRAVATRYDGHYRPPGSSSPLPRISFWSIWNEPNLGSADLAPQAIDGSTIETSPAMYRRLVDAAWRAFQQTGHASDTILIGEIAPYGQTFGNSPGNFGEMVPMRFVRALYCVGPSLQPLRGNAAAARGCPATSAGSSRFATDHPGLFHATGFAIHPYPQGSVAPDVVLADEPDFVNLASLFRIIGFLDSVTTTYGASRRYPLYITEYGYITNPPYQYGAPLALAAAYLNWAEYIAWKDLRIRSVDQYLLTDPPPGGPSNFDTGLGFFGGKPKPTYSAYRLPIFLPVTRAKRGQSLEVWGCVRPAHYAQINTGTAQRVKLELAPRSGGPFKSLGEVTITNPHGYFDTRVRFPSTGTVRLAWSYPRGPTVYSRVVAITIG